MNILGNDRKMIHILWNFAVPFRGWLALALGVILAGTALELYRPYLMKVAIDTQIVRGDFDGLGHTALLYAFTLMISVVLSYAENYILQYVGQFVIFNIRQKVFRHLLYEPYARLEEQKVGNMVTRVTNDTDAIRDLYTDVLVSVASDGLIVCGIVVAMLLMDWQLACIAFIIVPLMFGLALIYQKYARDAYRKVRRQNSLLNSFLQEMINNITVVKAFFRFGKTQREFEAVSKDYLAAGLQEVRTFALFRPLVDFTYTVAVLLVLGIGGYLNSHSTLQIGIVVAFLRYVEMFFWPIRDIAEKYNLLQSALAAAERVEGYLMAEKPAEEPDGSSPACEFRGAIRFENVWFAYQGEEWVLRDVSFSIRAGEFVGVAGFSGSGKSTLVHLLSRFYEPQRGVIYLDDVDIRSIPLDVLRRSIGMVFQDVHLFKGTIHDNLTLYDDSVSQEAVERAARTANVHQFIMSLPQKYQTIIGYQGALISAGQRQLLSMARVLVLPIRILVLDEATSSIDSETEAFIQDAFTKIIKQRTMIVIAHRLSTIEAADRILVIEQGRLVEEGNHEQLLGQNGTYARLYASQLHGKNEAMES